MEILVETFLIIQINLFMKKLQNIEHIEYNPNSSFLTIDGKEMIFMISNVSVAPDYEVSIWINSPFFVSAVDVLFAESLK